jgi:hypothetical protein
MQFHFIPFLFSVFVKKINFGMSWSCFVDLHSSRLSYLHNIRTTELNDLPPRSGNGRLKGDKGQVDAFNCQVEIFCDAGWDGADIIGFHANGVSARHGKGVGDDFARWQKAITVPQIGNRRFSTSGWL